jgi:hypothetical protein
MKQAALHLNTVFRIYILTQEFHRSESYPLRDEKFSRNYQPVKLPNNLEALPHGDVARSILSRLFHASSWARSGFFV